MRARGFLSPILEKAALFLHLRGLSDNPNHVPYAEYNSIQLGSWDPCGTFYSRDLLIPLSENKNHSPSGGPVIVLNSHVVLCSFIVLLSRGLRGFSNTESDAPGSTRSLQVGLQLRKLSWVSGGLN